MDGARRRNWRWVFEPLIVTLPLLATLVVGGVILFLFVFEGLGVLLLVLLVALILVFALSRRQPVRGKVL